MYKSKTNQCLLFIEYLNENRPKNLEILSSPKIRFFDMDYHGFFYVGNVRNVERLFSRLEKVKTARRPQLVFDEFLTIINHSCWKLGWPRWWPEKERHFEERIEFPNLKMVSRITQHGQSWYFSFDLASKFSYIFRQLKTFWWLWSSD